MIDWTTPGKSPAKYWKFRVLAGGRTGQIRSGIQER